MILREVVIENFLSIAEATVPFPVNGLVLLSGWNNTLGRANGAGKSAIMQAISWCLYSKFPRDIKVDEITKRGCSSCSVSVKVSFGSDEWIITRKRPSDLQVFTNGKQVKGNPKFLQALIEQEIGFTYDQWLVTSYFPQKGDSSRFLNQKDSSAKDFLGMVLNFSKAEQGYKKLHLDLKEKEVELASAMAKLSSLTGAVDRLKSIASMPIPELPDKEEVMRVKAELDLIKAMKTPDTTDLDQKINFLKKKKEASDKVRYQVSALEQSVISLSEKRDNLELPTHLTCPSCGDHLLDSGRGLVAFDEQSAEKALESKREAISKQIEEAEEKIKLYKTAISQDNTRQLDEYVEKKASLKSEWLVNQQKQKTLEVQLQSYKRMVEAYKQAKDQIATIKVQVDETEAQMFNANREAKAIEAEMILIVAAKQVLSPTGAIAYSLDSIIDDINCEVTSYLDIFSHGTMTYKMTSGDDKAKINHTVTYNGDDVSVGSLSGGEERGLILSVDLGLSEVLAKRCGVPLPSILMLDECFEGLDFIGKEKVLDALREVSVDRCIMLIDHNTEFSSLFASKISVTKIDSTSKVEVEV